MEKRSNASLRRATFAPARLRVPLPLEGKTTTERTPFRTRVVGLRCSERVLAYMRRHAGFKLGKFALCISDLEIRLKDENGPIGAPVVRCRVSVKLDLGGLVLVEKDAPTVLAAFDAAIEAAEMAVRRTLQRTRTIHRRGPRLELPPS